MRGKRPGRGATSPIDGVHGAAGVGSAFIPPYAVLPLRLFLGLTFLYAGVQKISDRGFLRPSAPTYIGTQLLSFSHGSPIRFFLLHLMEHAQIIGFLTILGELAIGAAVLLGLFTRLAALGGLVLNLVFFLSASWNVTPYFFGSDIVFVVAWLTLALTGPGPFSLDGAVHRLVGRYLSTPQRRTLLGPSAADGLSRAGAGLSRREAVAGGAAALILVILGLLPRAKPSGSTAVAAGSGPRTGTGSGTGVGGSGPGRKIGTISQLPPNTAGTLTLPSTGDPAVIIRLPDKRLVGFDAVCTHAGCTVEYDPQTHLLICPCHGGEYDPARGAQVVAGPPPTPLAKLPIRVDANGNIYLLS